MFVIVDLKPTNHSQIQKVQQQAVAAITLPL